MATVLDMSDLPEHLVLTGVSWAYYEQTLKEIGNQPIRVAYLDGMMELMSPLPEHEDLAGAIGDLAKMLAMELGIPRKAFRSATFRRKSKAAGAEPDECFYFYEIESIKGMKRFNPRVHRPPDVWIEVDLSGSSMAREAIYARLGVPEVWRHSGGRLTVRLLNASRFYEDSPISRVFPFLPMEKFAEFIPRMLEGDQTQVLLEFRDWVRSQKPG